MTESPKRRILVATDFSTRSDRAIRRASLLARHLSSELLLVHVVDDDQPRRLVTAECHEATALLDEIAGTIRSLDGVPCVCKVLLGEAFEGILRAGDEVDADLIVMGAHRRQMLRDIITGTTIERVIRQGRRPVLMANAVPAGNYHNILVAVDLSPPSAHAARTVQSLGVLTGAAVTALHAFEVPAAAMMTRANMTRDQIAGYVADEATQAKKALAQFMVDEGLKASRSIVRHISAAIHHEILACAREESAQLIVVGTHGRSGFAKLMLGSVAQNILQTAEQDVLAVPPSAES